MKGMNAPQGQGSNPVLQMDVLTPLLIEVITAIFRTINPTREDKQRMLDGVVRKMIQGLRQSAKEAKENPALVHMVIDGTIGRMTRTGENTILILVNNLAGEEVYNCKDIKRLMGTPEEENRGELPTGGGIVIPS